MSDVIYARGSATITPALVNISGTTYAVASIGSVRVTEVPPKGGVARFIGWAAGLFLTVFGLFAQLAVKNPTGAPVIWIGGLLILIPTVISHYSRSTRYVLLISTASGDRQALVSDTPRELDDIRRAIETAMAAAREVKPASGQPADTKVCPRCAETVKAAAVACRYCGHEFGADPVIIDVTPE